MREESDRLVEEDKGDKIVHGFVYRWIYVKKLRTNVLRFLDSYYDVISLFHGYIFSFR